MNKYRWILHPSLAVTMIVLVFSLVTFVKRDFKAAEILASFEMVPEKKHTIMVEVGIELEAFHMERFQSHGKMLKVDANKVYLRAVTSKNLDWFAHQPWINAITVWNRG